jgi:malonate transporter and related proteins
VLGVLTGFGIIAFVIAIGYVSLRTGVVGPEAGRVFNRMAFFVTNPALLFVTLAHAQVHVLFSSFVVISLIGAVAASGVYVLWSRLFRRRPLADTAIGAMASGYVNANNIGLPVAVYVLGDAQYVAPVLLLQLIVFAPVVLSILDAGTRGVVSVRSIATQPLRNPMILASVAGVVVAVTGVQVPDAVYQPFTLLGGAAVPLVLMAFGMSLSGRRPFQAGAARREVIVSALLKAVFMPAVAWLVADAVFGLRGHALFAAVVTAALPTAQNVFNFASRYGRAETLARDSVLLSTLLSVPVLVGVAAVLA